MLWSLNILVCIIGLRRAHRAKSALVILWAYQAYMGFIGLTKFTFGVVPINLGAAKPTFEHEIYLLGSNILFLATSIFLWNLMPSRGSHLRPGHLIAKSRLTLFVYIAIYGIGTILYFRGAIQSDYNAFVNYEGSAWAQVAFYSGASLIAILSARRKWPLALVLCLPYALLSATIAVRSFIALSFFPVLMLLLSTQRDQKPSIDRRARWNTGTFKFGKLRLKSLLGLAAACAALVYAINGASLTKHNEVTLPEEKLIEGYFIVTDALEAEPVPLGTESIERFFWGLGSPIVKKFGITYDRESDPPVIFASYIDEYSLRSEMFFHYPVLWQADTFAAFRYLGLLLAPFWAFVLVGLERVLRSNADVWVILLPVSCWVTFMFARGAIGNSTISVSYVILLQITIYLFLRLLDRRTSQRRTSITTSPTWQVFR